MSVGGKKRTQTFASGLMLKEHIRQAEEDAKSAVCLGEQAENVGFRLGGAHLAKVVLFSLGI